MELFIHPTLYLIQNHSVRSTKQSATQIKTIIYYLSLLQYVLHANFTCNLYSTFCSQISHSMSKTYYFLNFFAFLLPLSLLLTPCESASSSSSSTPPFFLFPLPDVLVSMSFISCQSKIKYEISVCKVQNWKEKLQNFLICWTK